METSRVYEGSEWDRLRLADIGSHAERVNYGRDYARHIIGRISLYIFHCWNIQSLVPYLERRRILPSKAGTHLLSLPETEAGSSLVRMIEDQSQELESGVEMIQNLYLALLDCYEATGNTWCHGMAVNALRLTVRMELKLPKVNVYDLTHVIQRVPHIALTANVASDLIQELGLSRYGSPVDLREILKIAFSIKLEFERVVLALLLTKHTGQYLTFFLPHCYCNPPAVYDAIERVGIGWRKLALYMGYSETKVAEIERKGGEDPVRQAQLFMRVWRMPDCGPERTREFMNQLMFEKLALVDELHSAHVHWDDGVALLNACQHSNWEKTEALVETKSYLGARDEEGRTPLMLACLKGKEKIVKLLIEHGADVHAMDQKGEACLNFSSTLRNRAILDSILEEYRRQRASVDVESLDTGRSPLSTACKNGLIPSVVLLLEHNANPDGTIKHRPLVEASAQGHIGLVKTLLNHRANIDATGKSQKGYTALIQACSSNQWGVAEVLINEGADVNKCAINDCLSPLYVAASADQIGIATKLIQKGAVIDSVTFQPGAVQGTVELTPLASATGKGLQHMIKLLLDNGADINYLCSNALPAIAFSILGDQIETFHLLLRNPNLNKTLNGLTSTMITSIRTERYYFTEQLLEIFGGPHVALMEAQQNGIDMLVENVMMYMQAVNHPSLTEVGLFPQAIKAPPVQQSLRLEPRDQGKVATHLTSFCRICTSAVLNSSNIQPESLIETAQAMGSTEVAIFFRQVLSDSMMDQDLSNSFLAGQPSPLRFLLDNNVLTLETFHIEVLKFHPEDSEVFYKDLVWTFQHMNGGADLPTNVDMMLKQLFSGQFVPRNIPSQSKMASRGTSSYQSGKDSFPAIHQLPHEASLEERRMQDKTFQRNAKDTPPLVNKADRDKEGQQDKSKGVQNVVDIIQNNSSELSTVSQTSPESHSQQTSPQSHSQQTSPQSHNQQPPSTPQSSHSSPPHQQSIPQPHKPTSQALPRVPSAPQATPQRGPPRSQDHSQSKPNTTNDSLSSHWVPVKDVLLRLRDTAKVKVMKPVHFGGINRKLGGIAEYKVKYTDEEEEKELCVPNVVVKPTGNMLGHGAYGDVYEVTYKGRIYAAKKYRFTDQNQSMVKNFGKEQNILARIRHRNIVPYYNLCTLPDGSPVLVMQKLETSLASYLTSGSVIPLRRKFRILHNIAQGLWHLHSQKPAVIHRDLTAGNVLLDRKGVAKISDFGNSKMVNIDATPELLTTNPGTLDYMPPEAQEGGDYNERLDHFSYGHLAIHIFIQQRPHPLKRATYKGKGKGKLIARTEVERREEYLERVKTVLGGDQHPFYPLIIQCLQDESNLRPSCQDIISNDAFKNF